MLPSSVCRVLKSTQKSVLVRAPDPQACPRLRWRHEVFPGMGGREDEAVEYFRRIEPRNSVPASESRNEDAGKLEPGTAPSSS